MEISTPLSYVLDQKPAALWSIKPDATVYDAVALMAEKNIGALPVMLNGRLLGLITERDYTRKVVLQGKVSRETEVAEIMSTDLHSVGLHDSVHDCLRLMTQHRQRHLPVMERDRMIGIVSIGDIVNWIITAQQVAIEDLERFVTGAYPA